jgi:hypothetical protein
LIRTFATESQIHTLRGKIYYDMSKYNPEKYDEAHKAFVLASNYDKKDSQKIKELFDSLQEGIL